MPLSEEQPRMHERDGRGAYSVSSETPHVRTRRVAMTDGFGEMFVTPGKAA